MILLSSIARLFFSDSPGFLLQFFLLTNGSQKKTKKTQRWNIYVILTKKNLTLILNIKIGSEKFPWSIIPIYTALIFFPRPHCHCLTKRIRVSIGTSPLLDSEKTNAKVLNISKTQLVFIISNYTKVLIQIFYRLLFVWSKNGSVAWEKKNQFVYMGMIDEENLWL